MEKTGTVLQHDVLDCLLALSLGVDAPPRRRYEPDEHARSCGDGGGS
jgi:hypothetical protein